MQPSIRFFGHIIFSLILLFQGTAFARATLDCRADGIAFGFNNEEVLEWKATSREQFKARAYVTGVITKIYTRKGGHDHVQMKIGPNPQDTLEVVYNKHFGHVPEYPLGASIEACGDYITARKPYRRYPASPDGALIHWVHRSKNVTKHEHGFVVVNGILYGHGYPQHQVPAAAGF